MKIFLFSWSLLYYINFRTIFVLHFILSLGKRYELIPKYFWFLKYAVPIIIIVINYCMWTLHFHSFFRLNSCHSVKWFSMSKFQLTLIFNYFCQFKIWQLLKLMKRLQKRRQILLFKFYWVVLAVSYRIGIHRLLRVKNWFCLHLQLNRKWILT